jgi:hypothetical protein
MPAQEGPDDGNSTRLSIASSYGFPTNDEDSTPGNSQEPGATGSIADGSIRTVEQVCMAIGRWMALSEELKAIFALLPRGLKVTLEAD